MNSATKDEFDSDNGRLGRDFEGSRHHRGRFEHIFVILIPSIPCINPKPGT